MTDNDATSTAVDIWRVTAHRVDGTTHETLELSAGVAHFLAIQTQNDPSTARTTLQKATITTWETLSDSAFPPGTRP